MVNRKSLCFFFSMMFFMASAFADTTTLQMKFKQGQTFTLENQINVNAKADLPSQMLTEMGMMPIPADGAKVTGTQNAVAIGTFNFDWDVTVKEVRPDGSALLEVILSKAFVKMNGQLGDDKFNYDTDLLTQPTADGQTATQLPEDSRTMTLVVAPNGAIISANDESIPDTLNGILSQLQAQQIDLNKDQVDNIAKMFINFYVRYPDKAVNVGDTWNNQVDLSTLMPQGKQGDLTVNQFKLQFAQDWKVVNLANNILNLSEKSEAMPKLQLQLESKDATVAIDAAGKEKGTFLINSITGMFNSIDRDLEMAGKLIAQDKNDQEQKWEIPFNLTVQSKLSVK